MAVSLGLPANQAGYFLAGDIVRDITTGEVMRVMNVWQPRKDYRLWDEWEWSELAPETHEAIRFFEQPILGSITVEWNEDSGS